MESSKESTMKKLLMTSMTLTLLASVATAEDGRSLRSALTSSLMPALLGQSSNISLPPPLLPVPDPLYSGKIQQQSGTVQQQSGTVQQQSETVQPYSGTVQPYSGTVQPYSATVQPYSGTVQPYSGTVQPYPAIIQPSGPVVGLPVPLFSDVRFRATRNIAPCAVPTIIQVADPCDKYCKRCVNIEVCAPPCNPKDVKVTRDGNRVRYDYGKYAIVAHTAGDHIVVRYHD